MVFRLERLDDGLQDKGTEGSHQHDHRELKPVEAQRADRLGNELFHGVDDFRSDLIESCVNQIMCDLLALWVSCMSVAPAVIVAH